MDKRIEYIKESLMSCVESQIKHLNDVDAEELGEVVDMLKDLAELEYYCAVTKAMEEYEPEHNAYYSRDIDRGQGRMYYMNGGGNGNGNSSNGSSSSASSSSGRSGNGNGKTYSFGGERMMSPQTYYSWDPLMMENSYEYQSMRDPKEGRSPRSRKMYMEHKHSGNGGDKTTQMKELETYMQELTQDIVEMIEGASPEEKQYLNKKIAALANKIV